ncbi:hypothetical protein GCM10007860_15500 [Chitiniphilus shinanonensis]|uniref:Uncharacterized protein n=1 Tax=Chitiniphilus shinanonensis TaxID=553088 RepID=A0ABQ6BQY7_9NEIS|nr:protein adenylyltransferase SelO family protein [Chitiniphilus shinanonensis]GLS04403.1 hypothetical protein GCM10007860_15500 [Chitiniphilus shinanonensis]
MDIQKILPASVFIPFVANRLKKAKLIYANLPVLRQYGICSSSESDEAAAEQEILEKFAYIVPTDEDSEHVTDVTKIFYAERYGGVGVLSNGGGARCGLTESFQVKGIGLTPVGGVGVNFWYSHGGLPLQEAIADMLLSQAADNALPFPGSRVVAVIDTGSYAWRRAYVHADPELDERLQVRRGLLIRESGIRPAHFFRAFYFKAKPEIKQNYPHDYHRVRECIPRLPAIMDVPLLLENAAKSYQLAIEKMMLHASIQLAVSKAKRFMHGSLTPSNFLIGGGWIDYGTASAVPSYGEVITTSNQPSYWQEYSLFQKTCEDLCYYVQKFVPDPQGFLNGQGIYQKFIDIYVKQLEHEMLKLTGLPVFALNVLMKSEFSSRLGRHLVNIAMYEKRVPHHHDFHAEFTWEAHTIRSVLYSLYCEYWLNGKNKFPDLPFSSSLNEELWLLYCGLCTQVEEVAANRGIDRQALTLFVAFEMTRRALPISFLYRDRLLLRCGHLVEEIVLGTPTALPGLAALIEENESLSYLLLRELESMEVPLYAGSFSRIAWNPVTKCMYFLLNEKGRLRAIANGGIQQVFLLDAFSRKLEFHERIDGSWAIGFPCKSIEDFEDINALTLAFDKENALLSMADLFPAMAELFENYRATLMGLPIPMNPARSD